MGSEMCIRDRNIRLWGELDQPIVGYAPPGAVFQAVGHVIGDTVDTENRWYIDTRGRRLWSGGTNKPNF